MFNKKNQNPNAHLLNDFLANGGIIKICKPKLAPKCRISKRKVLTHDQLKSIIE